MEELLKMEIGQQTELSSIKHNSKYSYVITRVPNGWIYHSRGDSGCLVFIPERLYLINNGFM